MPKLFLRLDLDRTVRLGPGKIRLLELIGEQGSISGAGRAMRMSYRRAWLLVDELNSSFCAPVVTTTLGGAGGGKAVVTPLGRSIIDSYRALESDAQKLVGKRAGAIVSALRRASSASRGRSH